MKRMIPEHSCQENKRLKDQHKPKKTRYLLEWPSKIDSKEKGDFEGIKKFVLNIKENKYEFNLEDAELDSPLVEFLTKTAKELKLPKINNNCCYYYDWQDNRFLRISGIDSTNKLLDLFHYGIDDNHECELRICFDVCLTFDDEILHVGSEMTIGDILGEDLTKWAYAKNNDLNKLKPLDGLHDFTTEYFCDPSIVIWDAIQLNFGSESIFVPKNFTNHQLTRLLKKRFHTSSPFCVFKESKGFLPSVKLIDINIYQEDRVFKHGDRLIQLVDSLRYPKSKQKCFQVYTLTTDKTVCHHWVPKAHPVRTFAKNLWLNFPLFKVDPFKPLDPYDCPIPLINIGDCFDETCQGKLIYSWTPLTLSTIDKLAKSVVKKNTCSENNIESVRIETQLILSILLSPPQNLFHDLIYILENCKKQISLAFKVIDLSMIWHLHRDASKYIVDLCESRLLLPTFSTEEKMVIEGMLETYKKMKSEMNIFIEIEDLDTKKKQVVAVHPNWSIGRITFCGISSTNTILDLNQYLSFEPNGKPIEVHKCLNQFQLDHHSEKNPIKLHWTNQIL